MENGKKIYFMGKRATSYVLGLNKMFSYRNKKIWYYFT